jgi:hypothetical protein
MIIRRWLLALALLSCARVADAQTWSERVWAGLNGGVQTSSPSLSDSFEVQQFVETGSVHVDYPKQSSSLFEGSVGVRVWKRLGVGVAVSEATSRSSASVTAQIPHPFFFNRLRSIDGTADTERDELGTHIQIAYLANVGKRIRLILSGGPSVIRVEQTFVTDVKFSQEYPYDTATFTGATTRRSSASKTGFNAGADVLWMFSRQIGAGGLVRFTRATVDEDAGNGRTVSVDAGGLQVGAGVRFLF